MTVRPFNRNGSFPSPAVGSVQVPGSIVAAPHPTIRLPPSVTPPPATYAVGTSGSIGSGIGSIGSGGGGGGGGVSHSSSGSSSLAPSTSHTPSPMAMSGASGFYAGSPLNRSIALGPTSTAGSVIGGSFPKPPRKSSDDISAVPVLDYHTQQRLHQKEQTAQTAAVSVAPTVQLQQRLRSVSVSSDGSNPSTPVTGASVVTTRGVTVGRFAVVSPTTEELSHAGPNYSIPALSLPATGTGGSTRSGAMVKTTTVANVPLHQSMRSGGAAPAPVSVTPISSGWKVQAPKGRVYALPSANTPSPPPAANSSPSLTAAATISNPTGFNTAAKPFIPKHPPTPVPIVSLTTVGSATNEWPKLTASTAATASTASKRVQPAATADSGSYDASWKDRDSEWTSADGDSYGNSRLSRRARARQNYPQSTADQRHTGTGGYNRRAQSDETDGTANADGDGDGDENETADGTGDAGDTGDADSDDGAAGDAEETTSTKHMTPEEAAAAAARDREQKEKARIEKEKRDREKKLKKAERKERERIEREKREKKEREKKEREERERAEREERLERDKKERAERELKEKEKKERKARERAERERRTREVEAALEAATKAAEAARGESGEAAPASNKSKKKAAKAAAAAAAAAANAAAAAAKRKPTLFDPVPPDPAPIAHDPRAQYPQHQSDT